MNFIKPSTAKPITLVLKKDLVKSIKRGHPWVYDQALQSLPKAPAGSFAKLIDKKDRFIAYGLYDSDCQLCFRVISLKERIPETLVEGKLETALQLRLSVFTSQKDTNAFRLFNGEGDGLPGLVCDVYNDTAVIQCDGAGPEGFWDVPAIAAFIAKRLSLKCVIQKFRGDKKAKLLVSDEMINPVMIAEHGSKFLVDVVEGQKTGFFLDQRENRNLIKSLAREKSVLNIFGYTGGFSIYAGLGGAEKVTTVDIANPAIQSAKKNWSVNHLSEDKHEAVAVDAFEFLSQAIATKKTWDLVICDPPSFAPSEKALEKAKGSYENLIALSAQVTKPGGLLAAASCSSHITETMFLEICENAISHAHRQATVVTVLGQPFDHPYPLVCTELRYLKFVLMTVH